MANWDNWLIVIPARLQSSRLKEKPLQDLAGKPLVARVYERLEGLHARGAHILVATDSQKVVDACKDLGIPVEMTSPDHESGTDRVHEISQLFQHPYVLNVQGDEPFVSLDDLEELANAMEDSDSLAEMGTMVYWNQRVDDFENPNIVKAVVGEAGRALYFSRSAIPFHRESEVQGFWQHQGIYAFTKSCLDKFCSLPVHPLESCEKLEQLRALAHGVAILTVEAREASIGIDTPEDLEDARKQF